MSAAFTAILISRPNRAAFIPAAARKMVSDSRAALLKRTAKNPVVPFIATTLLVVEPIRADLNPLVFIAKVTIVIMQEWQLDRMQRYSSENGHKRC